MWDDPAMDVQDLGPLRARRVVKTSGTTSKSADGAPLTVVLMHGYGAPGDDLVAMAGAINAPAGTTFVFPEAPLALSDDPRMGDARAWWHIDIGRYERAIRQGTLEDLVKDVPAGMPEARTAVEAMLDALDAETKAQGSRLVIGGFSQGSMIATDVVLRSKRPFAGLVILSGTLIAAGDWLPALATRKGLPVFQSHGTLDPILPFPVAQALHHAFVEAELATVFLEFDGGHGIPPNVMRDLGQWLTQLK